MAGQVNQDILTKGITDVIAVSDTIKGGAFNNQILTEAISALKTVQKGIGGGPPPPPQTPPPSFLSTRPSPPPGYPKTSNILIQRPLQLIRPITPPKPPTVSQITGQKGGRRTAHRKQKRRRASTHKRSRRA